MPPSRGNYSLPTHAPSMPSRSGINRSLPPSVSTTVTAIPAVALGPKQGGYRGSH